MIAPTLALALAVAAAEPAALEITGPATCPTPAEVAGRVAELLAPTPRSTTGAVPTSTHVSVTRDGTAVHLALLGPRGEELATRDLPAQGSCADLAAAAAVVVGAWRADLDPELTPAVHLPAPPPPARAIAISVSPPPPAPRPARAYAVGLGLLASESNGSLAPGATLAGWIALGRNVALDASVFGATSRTADVGAMPGVASWTRGALAVGPALAARRDRLRGAVHLQALAGLLHVRGVGLAGAASDTTGLLGGAAGARLEVLSGTSALWVGLDLCVWPGDQRLVIENVSEQGHLSRFDVMASAGLSFGNFP